MSCLPPRSNPCRPKIKMAVLEPEVLDMEPTDAGLTSEQSQLDQQLAASHLLAQATELIQEKRTSEQMEVDQEPSTVPKDLSTVEITATSTAAPRGEVDAVPESMEGVDQDTTDGLELLEENPYKEDAATRPIPAEPRKKVDPLR
jgi:hypothetical protein